MIIKEESKSLSIGEALDMGVAMAVAENHKNAVTMFRGVLIHEPDNFEAVERLGSSLFELKEYHEALYWFWRGLKMERRHPMALTNYGLTVSHLGHWAEGLASLERAARLADKKPLSPEAMALIYNNLGNCLERLKRYDEALVALDKGLSFKPNDPFPLYNRGIVLLRLNRQADGIKSMDRAIALRPNDADAIYNRGMGHLLLGNLKQGFADYEWRLVTSDNTCPNLGLPADKKWTGAELIEGKTILVHGEQGLGDTIQSLRFIEALQDRGAKVSAIVHNGLRSMVEAMPGVTVLEPGSDLTGKYDYWVAIMSLPLCLGIDTEEKLPAPWVPALSSERLERWRDAAKPATDMLNVGICWAGNFQHKNDVNRSIPLKQFAKLFDAPGCRFVSVQQMRPGETEDFAALKEKHQNLSALWLEDMADTAAVIQSLDLVITVDTSVAHLAATLGVPTWILIPNFGTDWRWMLGRADSPWYPAAKLWRQPKVGGWQSVIDAIRDQLSHAAEKAA